MTSIAIGLKAKRRSFDFSDKRAIIELAESSSVKEAVKLAHQTPGFEKVTAQQVKRWMEAKPAKKMGRPVNDEFEQGVLDNLVFTEIVKKDSADEIAVVANVAYSYASIRQAAIMGASEEKFENEETVRKMKFSNNWIGSWLQRVAFRRRRITTAEKTLPPVLEVQEGMSKIQQMIDVGGPNGPYADDEVVSADETAVRFGVKPLNHYVPKTADRATAPDHDDKARYTFMLFGDKKGKMAAEFVILKCTAKGADLSKTRVLSNLMKEEGFHPGDGWELRIWRRTLTLTVKTKETTKEYVRPYLFAESTGVIITIQSKAWMDTVGVCMWLDLSVGPHFKKLRNQGCVVWDNCGPHGVKVVEAVAAEWNIQLAPLPKNMTDKLQVMDLVVNGPYKAGLRRERTASLFDYFQSWKLKRFQAERDKTDLPPFSPPKPTIATGLRMALKVGKETFGKPTFIEGMRRSFVAVGLSKQRDGTYVKYYEHRKGVMYTLPNSTIESAYTASLGKVAAELDVEPRAEAEDSEHESLSNETERTHRFTVAYVSA